MTRQGHAGTDLASRRPKALKIERLLGLKSGPRPLELLEIGADSVRRLIPTLILIYRIEKSNHGR